MNARSVAMVGASNDPSRLTGRPVAYMLKLGFQGKIFPVNPSRDTVQGLPCHPSLRAIGEPVDLALVATPAASVESSILEGIEAGIRSFIVFSSGFAELDQEGRERQMRLARIAKEHGVGILGPNCLGVVNSRTGLVASFNTAMENNPLLAGNFGFVSQSGALGSYWLDAAVRSGIGFSHWITTGNECDIDAGEALEFLAGDADTLIIGMYAEDVRDVNALRRGLLMAAAAGKPVLVIKSGSSATGAAAAASHTGALAGDDRLYDACFAQCGAVRVQSISEMLDAARLFAWDSVPRSHRLGAMTVSGGAGVMIADAAEKEGLVLEAFEPAIRDRLAAVLPSFAKPNNPIDLTAAVITDRRLLAQTLAALCADGSLGMRVLFIGLLQSIAEQVTDAILAEAGVLRQTRGGDLVRRRPSGRRSPAGRANSRIRRRAAGGEGHRAGVEGAVASRCGRHRHAAGPAAQANAARGDQRSTGQAHAWRMGWHQGTVRRGYHFGHCGPRAD